MPAVNKNAAKPAIAAAVPAANNAAAVATDGAVEKPKRIQKRTPRALWGDRDGDGNLLAVIADGTQPADYDRKKFLPLKKGDFANSADYIEWLACQFDLKAASLHKKAIDERSLGSVADRAKAKKLRTLHEKFAALEKEMRDAGLDVDELLKD